MHTNPNPRTSMQLPLIVRQNSQSFVIRDLANTMICTVHYENDPGQRNSMKRLDEEAAREMATRIARLLSES